MPFVKYQHVGRLGTQSTDGILDGICYVFYKVDGTNGSVWMDDNYIQAGSRNRILLLDNDNAGFFNWVSQQKHLEDFFRDYPSLILYGEWLVPHSLKTYREDAWRRFYVFDVLDTRNNSMLTYEAYRGLCEDYGIDYIPPLAIIKRPNHEDLHRLLSKTGQFLVKDGGGDGEGIVIKNYDYQNKFGQQVWAKIVTNEFKELNHKEFGAPLINGTLLVEERIVDKYCTEEFIRKEQSKILLNKMNVLSAKEWINEIPWKHEYIPELLGRVWYEFIREESTEFLKEHKNPTINYRFLNNLVIRKVKQVIGI